MKILISTLIVAASAGVAMAQQPAAQAPAEAAKIYAEATKAYGDSSKSYQAARVVAELSASQNRSLQKNSPLSAEEVNESVQTLADGNRIVRNSTGKFYRNSEGRTRREGSGGMGGVFGTTFSFGNGVSITNPVVGQKYLLDSELKTARVLELGEGKQLTIAGATSGRAVEGRVIESRKAHELNGSLATEGRTIAPLAMHTVQGFPASVTSIASTSATKYETNTEELGQRDFEGVMAEGTRRTTTIPAGAIGNERPIEIVYERWYSKDIGMVVYSKNTDPRFGEQVYKLTNIVRAEPDPSLFAVPTTYKKVSENGVVYKVGTPSYPAAPKAMNVKAVPTPAKAGRP